MNDWKATFSFKSGIGIETYDSKFEPNKFKDTNGWVKVNGESENKFVLINLANVEFIEMERVEE